jgi:hypothetical protein
MFTASLTGPGLLAWTPFIHPMEVFHEWWYLLILPLSFGIAVIYKAVRSPNLVGFWRDACMMTMQIVLAMIGLAIVVTLIVQVGIPLLPAE